MRTYTMTMPSDLEKRKQVVEWLQHQGATDIGWDYELIFHFDKNKERDLIDYCVKNDLNLRGW